MAQIGDVTAVLRTDAGPMVRGFREAGREVNRLGTMGTGSLARVQNVMANIAAEVFGASGKFNTLIGNVLQFGFGMSLAGTAAIATIAAIGIAWDKLTEKQRGAKKSAEDWTTAVRNALKSLDTEDLGASIESARRELARYKDELEREEAKGQIPGVMGQTRIGRALTSATGPDLEHVEFLRNRIGALESALANAEGRAATASDELADLANRALGDLNEALVAIQPDLEKFFREFVNATSLEKMTQVWAGWNAELETSRTRMADLNALFQQLQTPAEQFAESVNLIQSALDDGLIGSENASRMFQNALDKLLSQTTEESKSAWEGAGEELANAMVHGIMAGLQGGKFNIGSILKGLAFTALNIAISRGIGALFAAPAAAATTAVATSALPAAPVMGASSITVNVPAATNPIAMSRDAQWMAALGESNRALMANGFRFSR